MDKLFRKVAAAHTVITFDFSTEDPFDTPFGIHPDTSDLAIQFLEKLGEETFSHPITVKDVCQMGAAGIASIALAQSHFGQCEISWNDALQTLSTRITVNRMLAPQNEEAYLLTSLIHLAQVNIFSENNKLIICADLIPEHADMSKSDDDDDDGDDDNDGAQNDV